MAAWTLKADAALLACEFKRQALIDAWPVGQLVDPGKNGRR